MLCMCRWAWGSFVKLVTNKVTKQCLFLDIIPSISSTRVHWKTIDGPNNKYQLGETLNKISVVFFQKICKMLSRTFIWNTCSNGHTLSAYRYSVLLTICTANWFVTYIVHMLPKSSVHVAKTTNAWTRNLWPKILHLLIDNNNDTCKSSGKKLIVFSREMRFQLMVILNFS